MTRVLGVDPGLTRCGLGVVEFDPRAGLALVHYEVIRTPASDPIEARLHAVARGLRAAVAEHRPAAIAIERVFAQNNRSTVMGVAQISGVALELAASEGIPVALHTPTEVKAAVTGYGQADKAQVAEMVRRLLRLEVAPRPADAADALALAICHAWRTRGAGARPADGAAAQTPAQAAWAQAERRARGARR